MEPTTAHEFAMTHLANTLPRRWSHVRAVGRRAQLLSRELDEPILTSAAWLHDIGYAPCFALSEFHPLDGARALQNMGANNRLCGLVAFHSAAIYEAEALNLSVRLKAYPDESGIVRDLLWYLDMTTGPTGDIVTFDDRMADVRRRYPVDHYVSLALDHGMPERRAAVERAEHWLTSVGLTGHV